MAAVVGNISGCDVSIHTRQVIQSNKCKLVLYKPLQQCFKTAVVKYQDGALKLHGGHS